MVTNQTNSLLAPITRPYVIMRYDIFHPSGVMESSHDEIEETLGYLQELRKKAKVVDSFACVSHAVYTVYVPNKEL